MSEATQDAAKKPTLTPDEVIASQRSRQLTIVSVVLLALALGVAATKYWKQPEVATGSEPLASLKPEDVVSVELFIGAAGERVKLFKDGEIWRLTNRFNALADSEDVELLIKKAAAAKRLVRAATDDKARFSNYELGDEQAPHLLLADKQGKELLHVLVGKGDNSSTDFIRYGGKTGASGVFELVDFGGSLDTLRSRLQLDADGKLDARSWLDVRAFKTLPGNAEATKIKIHDKDLEIELESTPDASQPGKRVWQVVAPERSFGNASAAEGIISALSTLTGFDVAGRPSPQGPELGLSNDDRWVEVKFSNPASPQKMETLRVDFGKKKDTEVAVWVSAENKGEFLWWVNDFIIGRIFRPVAEYCDVAPFPAPGPAVTDSALVQHILVSWTSAGVTLKRPRSKAEARKLAEDVLNRAKTAGSDWKALQLEFNEDGAPHTDYPVDRNTSNLAPPFKSLALSLKAGEFGIVETQFGYHIMKRLE